MKLNGKNIITSKDVTVVGEASNLGNDLDNILVSLQGDIQQLKSNVKWLYKYGGVGSGGGSSSGTSNTLWSAYISFGNQSVEDKGTIVLSGTGTYTLSVSISNPQGREFTVRYKLGDSTRYSSTYKLNSDNTWQQDISIAIAKETTLVVEVRDPNNEILLNTVTIKPNAYTFDAYLTNNSGTKYTETNIFIDEIEDNGLMLEIPYNIVVDYKECSLDISFNDKSVSVPIENDFGTIKYNLKELISNLSNDSAGSYTWSIDINLLLADRLTEETIDTLSQSIYLIPNDFYILVTPDTGTIYKLPLDYDSANKYLNGTINLHAFIYNGKSNNGSNFTITTEVYLNGNLDDSKTSTITERTDTIILINAANEGSYEVKLKTGTNYSKSIYLYVFDLFKDVDYFSKEDTVYESTYYRTGTSSDTLRLSNEAQFKLKANGNSTTIDNLNIKNTSSDVATLISFGLKFSEINSENKAIFTLKTTNNDTIEIFPTKVSNSNKVITIAKCSDFNTDNDGYHLITICLHKVAETGTGATKTIYYGRELYIDGKLELGWSDLTTSYLNINSITLNPLNYYINLLEVDYILNYDYGHIDTVVVNYYKAYQLKKLQQENIDRGILNVLMDSNTTYTFKDNAIVLNSSAVSKLSQASKIPTLLFYVSKSTQNSVLKDTDMELNIKNFLMNMGDSGINCPEFASYLFECDFYYALAGEDVINSKKNPGSENHFYFNFQGSSTYIFPGKNLLVGIKGNTVTETVQTTPVFTPNYSKSDTTTFLPETKFNLKADSVDSSHTNNNACGAFINTEVPRLYDDTTYEYNTHVKNCLEGFPVMVILNLGTGDENSSSFGDEFYLLGIYNFNLGRDSYFNLGYSDLTKALKNESDLKLEEGFGIYTINGTLTSGEVTPTIKDDVWVAEILNNTSGFDFSQYDKTVLFAKDTATQKDTGAMFGDLVYTGDSDKFQNNVLNFVKATTKAGAFIWNSLGKSFGDRTDDYHAVVQGTDISKNQVPDYKIQYKRTLNEWKELPEENLSVSSNDLSLYVNGNETEGVSPNIDYTSLLCYYVICMAFGLVDSVIKNLNLKSFNKNIVKTAFYDMDSCFALNNAGASNVDFKAFSDYWLPNIDSDGNVGTTTIYRDYNPSTGFSGYDLPSSYLFAIAKYASSMTGFTETLLSPQLLWYKWRNETTQLDGTRRKGPLYNADTFIENFYINHTKDIDPLIFNLNYRFKYFKLNLDNGKYLLDSQSFTCFNGSRIEYVRDWVNKRLHFLDMCFNLLCAAQPIMVLDEATNEYKRKGDNDYYLNTENTSTNSDVIINNDIFSSDGLGIKRQSYDFIVSAIDYSPLVITIADTSDLYLLESSENTYKFKRSTTGSVTTKFGGSSNWTYIDDVGSFVNDEGGTLYINSRYLENIKCSTASVGGITLITPSVTEINFSGNSKATGTLTFSNTLNNDSYPNLTTINIANSKLNLTVDKEEVKTINISGVNSNFITIQNCSNIETLTMSSPITLSLQLSIAYGKLAIGKNVVFSGHSINQYNISIDDTFTSGSTLTITNDHSVTTINALGYEKVYIQECSNLKTIILGSTVKTLQITGCSGNYTNNRTAITCVSDVTDSGTPGTLDLSKLTNLESLLLTSTVGFDTVKLPNKVVYLEQSCFENTYLEYLDGGIPTINGIRVFCNAPYYALYQSNGDYSNLKTNTSKLNYTFYNSLSNYTVWETTLVLYFLDRCITDKSAITDIDYLFRNRGIKYPLKEALADKDLEETSAIQFKGFTNIQNARRVFEANPIEYWNPYMFADDFGLNESSYDIDGFLRDTTTTSVPPYSITYDSYKTIANKVTILSGGGNINDVFNFLSIKVVDTVGNQITDVELSKIFDYSFDQLLTLRNFTIACNTLDFENAFINTPNITTLYNVFRGNPIAVNFDKALYPLTKLITISGYSFLINNISEAVDLFTWINWEQFFKNGGIVHDIRTNASSSVQEYLTFPRKITREDYLKLWNLIFYYHPSSINHLFYNCTLLDSYDASLPEGTSDVTTNLILLFDGFKSSLDLPIEFDLLFFNKLTGNTIYMYKGFANTKWANAIPFDFFKARQESRTQVIVDDGTDLGEEVTLIEYTYKNKTINIPYCWYNCTFASGLNYFLDEDSVTPNRIVDTETGKVLDYTTYTLNGVKKSLLQNTEYSDVLRALKTKCEIGSGRNNRLSISEPKLFVSPDILYNSSLNGTSGWTNDGIFGNSNLQGLIPWNMNKNTKSNSFTGIFRDLDIIPYQIYSFGDDSDNGVFLFVPDNFTTVTTLSGAFNFKMRVPAYSSGSDYNSIYLVCSTKSIGNITSLSEGMPNAELSHDLFSHDENGNGLTYHTKVIALYNFMGEINIKTNNTYEIQYGIPKNKLSNDSAYSNLFDTHVMAITCGELVRDITITSTFPNLANNGYMTKVGFGNSSSYVGEFIKLPKMTSLNSKFMSVDVNTGTLNISSNQLVSSDNTTKSIYNLISPNKVIVSDN